MKLLKLIVIIGIIILIFIICFIYQKPYTEKNIIFGEISGKIFEPKIKFNNNCFVFVHGDGPMDEYAMGFYKPYFGEFAKHGYCSISWTKPEDYKSQSMRDRAKEVEEAIGELSKYLEVKNIIIIGWSQSAWLMGYLNQDNIDGIVQIGGAVDWISQGKYMTKVRGELEGWSKERLQEEIKEDEIFNGHLLSGISYKEYLTTENSQNVGKQNWNYWQKNISEDIRDSYHNIKVPYLSIFGGQDAHVDVEFSSKVYTKIFEENDIKNKELFYKNANHIIIKSKNKHFVNDGINGFINFIKNEFLGLYAYPNNYFQDILDFVKTDIIN